MAFDEKIAAMMAPVAEKLLELLVDEAHAAVGETIERFSLSHEKIHGECLSIMRGGKDGEWVPWNHHKAFVAVLGDAIKAMRSSDPEARASFLRKVDAGSIVGLAKWDQRMEELRADAAKDREAQ